MNQQYFSLLQQARYEAAEKSLYHFYKYSWDTIDPAQYEDNWHIGLICEHLQAQFQGEEKLRKIIISIQPRVSKSLITSVCYPAWQWLHKPETSLICVSHTIDLAAELAVKTRDLILSPWYSYWTKEKSIFQLRDDKNQKTQYSNNKQGARLSVSPHKAIHGFGANTIIIDDPNSTEDIYSVAKQESVKNFHKGSLRNRCNSPAKTLWILVQQRLGMKDLTQFVLESEDEWFHLVVPSEYTKHYTFKSPIGKNDPRKKEGELLWPSRFNKKWYEEEKKDPFFWASIYQQHPISLSGNIIKSDWIKYYDKLPDCNEYNQLILSADLGVEKKMSADYSAFVVIGKTNAISNDNKKSKYFIHDFVRGKYSFPEMVNIFRGLIDKYSKEYNGNLIKLIERKGAGAGLIDTLQEVYTIEDIVGINPVKSKEDRLIWLQPLFINGLIWFLKREDTSDIIDELLAFPKGKNDDYVDALSQGLNWLFYEDKGAKNSVYIQVDSEIPEWKLKREQYFDQKEMSDVREMFGLVDKDY